MITKLQSIISLLCGHYCMLRNNGITMREIVNSLSSDSAFNDAFVDFLLVIT